MKFNEIEIVDLCEDVAIYWVNLSEMPEAVQSIARGIDGEEYDALGFGACVGYDFAEKEFFFFTDNDTTANANVYYVGIDGDKRWFRVEMGDELTQKIFDACNRINNCLDTPMGYAIQKTTQVDRSFGLVLAQKDDPVHPFTIWMFKETAEGLRDYGWNRCYEDEKTAKKAFANAVAEHINHERTVHFRTVKATTWGAGKKPSIKEQLLAKSTPIPRPTSKPKAREER